MRVTPTRGTTDDPAGRGSPRESGAEPCPECGGRGWKIKPDGGAGTAVRCDCAKRTRNLAYLAQSGIPERYRDCRLNNFKTRSSRPGNTKDQLVAALRQSEHYVDQFLDLDSGKFTDTGLIYIGPPGTGKTHLAAAVLHELIRRYGVRGRFIDFTTLLRQIQATFDPDTKGSAHSVLKPIFEAEILVLDELGAQKPTEWVQQTLYDIINTRYTGRRPTIFTTNYRLGAEAPADPRARRQSSHHASVARGLSDPGGTNTHSHLSTRISPSLESRIHEMARPIRLDVDDYRLRNRPVGLR